MRSAPDKLVELLRDEVELLGYELVGVELIGGEKSGALLRVYIDHADGITLDDCVQVSHQVSGVLDVEDPIRDRYRLEISSPGLDRPLFKLEDFARFIGHKVKIKTRQKIGDRHRFSGTIKEVDGNKVVIDEAGTLCTLGVEMIVTARLDPEF